MSLLPRAAAFVGALLAITGGGAAAAHRALAELPPGGRAAAGVRIEGELVGERDPGAVAHARAAALLDRDIALEHDGRVVLKTSLRALGATHDAHALTTRAHAVARQGDTLDRWLEARRVQRDGLDLHLRVHVPVEALAAALDAPKDAIDARPRPAKRHLATGAVEAHQDGALVDVHAAAETLLGAARRGDTTAALPVLAWAPAATTEAARAADVKAVLASFETRFGGPVGRDKNILRAAAQLDGVVLMPGDEVSFNEVVGPRTTDNGFFPAPEIYRGEMREGIGGGACQVASTLHAAALFGGLTIPERRNHSRPSGYIRPGLDATVAYPVLDLRVENPFPFPVVLTATATGGALRFELRGADAPAEVRFDTETVGVLKYRRKLEKTAVLAPGEHKLKQKGKRGLRVRRVTTTALRGAAPVVHESVDTYPATQEIWLVAPDVAPTDLPPLDDPDAAMPAG